MKYLKIWHDPQHGGENKGSEYFGLIERIWNVEMVLEIMFRLENFSCVQETARRDDRTIYYHDRAENAKAWGANIAFLHHVNAMVYPDGHELGGQPWPKFDGLMTFYLSQSQISREVATMIGRSAPVELLQKKPTYAANPYDWTSNAYNCLISYEKIGIPTVLIEWGFSTSPIDREFLTSEFHRPSLIGTMACGYGRAIELLRGNHHDHQNKICPAD